MAVEHARASLLSRNILLGTYSGLFGLFLFLRRNERGDGRLKTRDLIMVGIATHKLSRTITRDKVTAGIRSPFARFKEPGDLGEVIDEPRGKGLQYEIGTLITCPFCFDQWAASFLIFGLALQPRLTRLALNIFTTRTIADFLQLAYESVRKQAEAPVGSAGAA